MNTFINMIRLLSCDVSTRTNTKTSRRNRKDKANTIQTGFDRCPIRQAQHRRAGSECFSRILSKLHKEIKTGKSYKGTFREKAKTRATSTITIPSFLFSYNTLLILQSIDDICAQINPMLWSMIL